MENNINKRYKSFTSLEQSKKLAEILPLESADMCYPLPCEEGDKPLLEEGGFGSIPCWSLASLIEAMPEILIETVKAQDGYDGYYYFVTYEDEIGVPYEKELIDACYEMILKLYELNLL